MYDSAALPAGGDGSVVDAVNVGFDGGDVDDGNLSVDNAEGFVEAIHTTAVDSVDGAIDDKRAVDGNSGGADAVGSGVDGDDGVVDAVNPA
eukprot:scaffold479709_cov14-Prasinocladus_malaysianus.AAC.1